MKRIVLVLLCSALFFASSAVALTITISIWAITSANHVVIIVIENNGHQRHLWIILFRNCSYITQLANKYGLAENSSGVAHHSLPNYLTLTSAGNYSRGLFQHGMHPADFGMLHVRA